ncbi:chromosome segregation ATPase [Bartonella krasnovii]|uniref:Chromosome segregation ATPase n=1 Tax=Bartonella krasnovii TaxID=2267275 RepID=A0A5B9D1T1_9HYPH|nr:chromosome segregation ATPase [Bartonella krasnovii]
MLIQSFLFFILGVASTSWLLVLLSPLIWRKAVHFAHKGICAQIPLSLTEIQANQDFIRAQHAVELAKNQQKYESLQKKYAQQKIHLSQVTEQLYQLYLPAQNTSPKESIAIKQNIVKTNSFKGNQK